MGELMASCPISMSSQAASGKPPQAPPSVHPPAKSAGLSKSGYVSRYKLQQQRIRTLNQLDSSSEAQKQTKKCVPKIQNGPDKEDLVTRAVQRSNTIDVIKLPGVKVANPPTVPPSHLPSQKRKPLPTKTYHLKVNWKRTSFISQSLSSLPSIPGSPSYPEDQSVSPLTQRPPDPLPDFHTVRLPVFPSRHRFEKIVFEKRIHRDSTDMVKSAQNEPESKLSPRRLPPAIKTMAGLRGPAEAHGAGGLEKPHMSGSVQIRYSKVPSEEMISEAQSEPPFEVSRKWKDNCRCLRCQMLKRHFQEGDSHYGLWGRYPCHHVDPFVMLDD